MERTLKECLKEELQKKAPDRSRVLQLLEEMKQEELSRDSGNILLRGQERAPERTQRKRKPVQWKRAAIAAAVALVLLMCVPSALGCKGIFSAVGRWTKEIFSFGDNRETSFVFQTDRPELQELYDLVAEFDLSKNVVPTWIPDDAVLDKMTVEKIPDGTVIYAGFIRADGSYVVIKIKIREALSVAEYQKNEDDAILYDRADIKHYIMSNDQKWTAAWSVKNMECTISVNSKVLLFQMLDSIYSLEE